jgi:prefoldin beta subunit
MNIDSETSKKIQELQMLEHNLQSYIMQKQTMQVEMNEINTALDELKKSGDEVYKILGGIMIKSNKTNLTAELNEKKKLLEMRLNSIEKQEKMISSKSEELKEEINKSISKEK